MKSYLDSYKLLLNSIKKPSVCDIESQSVLVRLTPIEIKSIAPSTPSADIKCPEASGQPIAPESNYGEGIYYTLELANETNVFNQVYTGDANEITLKDLKPYTKYFLR
jgi:hypothetical protein